MSQASIRSAVKYYVIGFLLSIALTGLSFAFVYMHTGSHHELLGHDVLTFSLIVFAITQLVVQMVFFLHLGQEKRPRWNFIVFLFMLTTLFIIVFGSLWIMDNLNYNMMSPSEVKSYMRDHESF